jgi:hypothetical protein
MRRLGHVDQNQRIGAKHMINRIFFQHPQSVDEGYFEHMWFALRFATLLICAAGAALIHAFIPAACEKTASKIIATLYARTHNRGT